jgi:hypothetical protein
LQARGDAVWQDVETEIDRRNAKGYAAAVALLLDLEALGRERGNLADFSRRRDDIRARHSRKPAFLARLDRPAPE